MYHAPTRRVGLGDSFNPTTIWTPSTGFLSSAGNPASGVTQPAFQSPNLVPTPACASEPGVQFTQECIDQVLAAQKQNMAAQNNANYQFDVQTCRSNLAENNSQRASLGMSQLPDTCAENTYGLTPVGGYTGGVSIVAPNAASIVGANDQVWNPATNSWTAASAVQPAVTPAEPLSTPAPAAPAASGPVPSSAPLSSSDGGALTAPAGYVAPSSSFFDETVSVGGMNIPDWALLAAAGLAAVFLMGGRR